MDVNSILSSRQLGLAALAVGLVTAGPVDAATSASRARNNPYHGRDLPDPVVATYWQGRQTYRR